MKTNFLSRIFSEYYQLLLLNRRIRHWQATLSLNNHCDVHQRLYTNVNGFVISRQMRLTGDAMEYVYGEIDFISLIALLSLTNLNQKSVFYDLGSGIGNVVIACAMVFDVKKSCGVELFEGLHRVAITQKNRLSQLPIYFEKMKKIEFLNKNFLQMDCLDATVVFINATGLFGQTWNALNQNLNALNSGTLVITTSKKLISTQYALIKSTKVQMSWGVVNAFIQKKI